MLMIVLERVNVFRNTVYNTHADGRPSLKIKDKGWRRGKREKERELRNTRRFGRKKRSLLKSIIGLLCLFYFYTKVVVLFYVLFILYRSMYCLFFIVLCIVCFVSFYVLFLLYRSMYCLFCIVLCIVCV